MPQMDAIPRVENHKVYAMLRKATAFLFGGLLTTAETKRWILWVRQ